MSNERRVVLFVLLAFGWILVVPAFLKSIGLAPPERKAVKPAVSNVAPGKDGKAVPKGGIEAKPDAALAKKEPRKDEPAADAARAAGAKSDQARTELVKASDMVLGSDVDRSAGGYRLELRLNQIGAGVEKVTSSRFETEYEGRQNPHRPLTLMHRRVPAWPPSFGLTMIPSPASAPPSPPPADAGSETIGAANAEDYLDQVPWEVVRGTDKKIVQALSREDKATKRTVEGQQVSFRTKTPAGVIVTKTFRLWQDADGFEFDVQLESPDRERTVAYNLFGPVGLPIEGEWYTGTFREVVFGTTNRGAPQIDSRTAYEIAKPGAKVFDSTSLPLVYAGVENQYFATVFGPNPAPTSEDDRLDRETVAVVLGKDEAALQKADVTVRVSTKPVTVGPNRPLVHQYRAFAGPKTSDALAPYGAEDLSAYRKGFIPGASLVARAFITPTLSTTYKVTEWFSHLFGGTRGNYGIAIILMTLFVKLLMFPLGRKQALMAQRTQAIQPYMKEIQEKYKDDKDRLTKETWALYKKHGVNPVSGCIPALIQLPIFVGLWQALNTSVPLRHAPFLWINDLAAPDMLFRFPFEIPLVGSFLGQWFNVLPILVVGLMLVQTKLFSPPPTTPEAEMQQKTMKYMMVFMAFMFYKVPSGLGIYFITSSLWSIGERLLLPKITHTEPVPGAPQADDGEDKPGRDGGPRGKGPVAPAKPPGALSQFWERLLDEARKDPTYRKMVDEREGKPNRERRPEGDDPRDRDRGKPKARPTRR